MFGACFLGGVRMGCLLSGCFFGGGGAAEGGVGGLVLFTGKGWGEGDMLAEGEGNMLEMGETGLAYIPGWRPWGR